MSNPIETGGFAVKLAMAIASASILGGGSMVLDAHRDNAVQDQRLDNAEKAIEQIGDLNDALAETNKNLAVFNERLDQQEKHDVSRND